MVLPQLVQGPLLPPASFRDGEDGVGLLRHGPHLPQAQQAPVCGGYEWVVVVVGHASIRDPSIHLVVGG